MVRLGWVGEVRLGTITITYDFRHLNRGQEKKEEEEEEEKTRTFTKLAENFGYC